MPPKDDVDGGTDSHGACPSHITTQPARGLCLHDGRGPHRGVLALLALTVERVFMLLLLLDVQNDELNRKRLKDCNRVGK